MGGGALREMSNGLELAPGDVVLTRSGGLVGWAIRVFTRRIGESRTKATHTGIVLEGGPIQTAVLLDALGEVKTRSTPR